MPFVVQVVSRIGFPSGSDRKTITGIWSGMNFSVKLIMNIGARGGVSFCSFLHDIVAEKIRKSRNKKIEFRISNGYRIVFISFAAEDFFPRLKSFERLIAKEYLGVSCFPL